MGDGHFPGPEDISLQEFRDALAKYDELIEAVSASKGGKKSPRPLLPSDIDPEG